MIQRFSILCFIILICQFIFINNSYAQDTSAALPFEFDTGYAAVIGEKIYALKPDRTTKVKGIIRGVKKNRDDTTYMLIEFKEWPQPGTPIFLKNKVIGMIYRQSTSEDLFEAMPVKVVLDFITNLRQLSSSAKVSRDENQEKLLEGQITKIRQLISEHNYDMAVKILQDELKKNQNSALFHGWMGVAMVSMGNDKNAAEEFKKAIALEPDNADFHNGLGYALLALGNSDEAIVSFKKAIKLNPRHADAHYGLGRAYIGIDEIQLATKEYTILKELDNKMADSLFQLILGR